MIDGFSSIKSSLCTQDKLKIWLKNVFVLFCFFNSVGFSGVSFWDCAYYPWVKKGLLFFVPTTLLSSFGTSYLTFASQYNKVFFLFYMVWKIKLGYLFLESLVEFTYKMTWALCFPCRNFLTTASVSLIIGLFMLFYF